MPDDHPSPWSAYAPSSPPSGPQPGPQPGGPPGGQQGLQPGWPPVSPYASPPAPPLDPYGPRPAAYVGPPVEVRVEAPQGRTLAVVGVVLGGLALLGVLITLAVVLVVSGTGDDTDTGGGYAPMRGTIAPAADSGLDGSALADEISRKVVDDGGSPDGITCPATPGVAQDVTTVCHGRIDGEEWAFVVFFEDEKGDYTLLEV